MLVVYLAAAAIVALVLAYLYLMSDVPLARRHPHGVSR